jgi:hypothetical protein
MWIVIMLRIALYILVTLIKLLFHLIQCIIYS